MNDNMEKFVSGFVCLLEGLARILSLGFYAPSWELDYWCCITERKAEREIKLTWVHQNTKLSDVDLDEVEEELEEE